MPPQVNGRLVKIDGSAAASDDWDVAPDAGADAGVKFDGELEAYYREATRRAVVDGAVNVFTARTVWVDTAALDELELDTDDVVTLELDDGRQVQAPAKAVARSALAGAGAVSTTRIDLEDA